MRYIKLMSGMVAAMVLTACGGGGGGSSAPSTPVVTTPPVVVAPYEVQRLSYDNAKNLQVGQITKPVPGWMMVQAVADFTRSGRMDMVVFKQNYTPETVSQAASTDPSYLSDILYYRGGSTGYTQVTTFKLKGCLHPRKAVVADFNGDHYPDIVVACHGYDGGTNPGEQSLMLVNDKAGGFTVGKLPGVGFYHGAAAFDTTGNGYSDLVMVDDNRSPNVYVLRNQKDGTFAEDNKSVQGLSNETFRYFSVEVTDVDGDGALDLLVGGNEVLSGTQILYGDTTGSFGVRKSTIPSVNGRGVVLDFTLVNENGIKILFVGRTADETSAAGYYNTQTLQRVDLLTMTSSVPLDVVGSKQNNWIAWWIPVVRNGLTGVQPYSTVDDGDHVVGGLFFQ